VNYLAVVSAKGGVGKTTFTASLAGALARERNVACVDLDPQNALRLHLGVSPGEIDGVARCSLEHRPWQDALFHGAMETGVLPFGEINESDRDAFEAQLAQDPGWLARGLSTLGLAAEDLVIFDTPPGPSLYLQQALRTATHAIVVLQPDAASYATIPHMEHLLQKYCGERDGFQGAVYLLNNVDSSRSLSTDVVGVVRAQLGDRLVPMVVHHDEAVREALAYDQLVLEYDPHCEASHDIAEIARWVLRWMTPAATQRRGFGFLGRK
jgi:cellulose synthase operon protein YhjQ